MSEHVGTLRWFGRAFDAPMYEGMPEVPAPVGEKCGWCREEILDGEPGITMPFVHKDDAGEWISTPLPYHIECHVRQAVGGLAHQEGKCFCFTGKHYDLDMTEREEAIKVIEGFWGKDWKTR